jgi:predicted PurR-regulated permease PerM
MRQPATSVRVGDEREPEEPTAVEPEVTSEVPPPRTSNGVRMSGPQAWAVVSLGVVAVVAALRLASGFFVPLLTSIVIALALAPIVRRLARWLPRGVAAALVVGALVGGGGLLAYTLADEAVTAIGQLPTVARQLREAVRAATSGRGPAVFGQVREAIQEIERTATESTERPATPRGVTPVQVVEPPLALGNIFWTGSRGVAAVAGQLVMMIFLVYFLLAFGELFKRKIVRLSGERLSRRRVTVEAIDQIGERVAQSLSHLVLMGILVGVATWLAFSWMGVQYAALWGIAAAVMNAVPYFGPTVVAALATVAAFLQFASFGIAAAVGAVSLAITAVEGFLLTPMLFGQAVRVNPVAVFVSALFWGWLWGGWGLLLSLPLLVIVKTIAESVTDLKPLAEMLSD